MHKILIALDSIYIYIHIHILYMYIYIYIYVDIYICVLCFCIQWILPQWMFPSSPGFGGHRWGRRRGAGMNGWNSGGWGGSVWRPTWRMHHLKHNSKIFKDPDVTNIRFLEIGSKRLRRQILAYAYSLMLPHTRETTNKSHVYCSNFSCDWVCDWWGTFCRGTLWFSLL